MSDLPIMLTDPLVLASYRGDKTETRRNAWGKGETLVPVPTKWQRLKAGDRLFVQESWTLLDAGNGLRGGEWCRIRFKADDEEREFHLTPEERLPKPSVVGNKMFMPRWMSRGTLILTRDARIEPLQAIDEAGARAEGVQPAIAGQDASGPIKNYRTGFVRVWAQLHGTASWLANPEVVVLTFKAHKLNIDELEAMAA